MHSIDTLRAPAEGAGLVLDRYRLVRRLGSGGFGVVWLAHDVKLDRAVAVKRLALEAVDGTGAPREAQAAARLTHPGIVALYEAGSNAEACYLVSELVRGETLGALLADGALSDRDVLRIGVTLCEALAHAHARGVIHRDVKPGNVMVPDRQEDGGGVAKLTDFGIARIVGGEALTATGDVVGTLAYMAPEQAEGRRITPAVDVYALGLVLFESLAGVNPVRGHGPADTARRVGEPLPELGRMRRDLPAELCEAIDAAVEVVPADRGTLTDLRTALLEHVTVVDDEPGIIEGSIVEEATRRWSRLRREPQDLDLDHVPAAVREAIEPAEQQRATSLGAWTEDVARVGVMQRLVAGLAASGLAVAAVTHLPPAPAPVSTPTVAAVAAVLVALLPRLAWLACALAAVAWVAASGGGDTADALLLAAVLAPVPLLLLRAPVSWSMAALAPLLGMVGLAGAWPALAGQASTVVRRAALGALGALWLAAVEVFAHRTLLGAAASGPHAAPTVQAMIDTGVVAVAPVWALAAAMLPWLVRGRNAVADALAGGTWAAGAAVATGAALHAAGAPHARGLAAAAAVSAALAMATAAARSRPEPHPAP